ncbi:type VII toxin-antitoxin system HepT family RNase toxin [Pseudomonas sp. DWRC2-2]|uniref:type VII toxin-antitoxin system HepT family RNase toxin n=1 Tax=Pseudomonas sp. DWRC2-2 TaxID=2804567 RepID=UPI003CEDD491
MVDDVLINKASSIERFVARAREEYDKDPDSFATDFTRQDAAILNIQRACEAALDMGQHLIRRERLGVPQGARDVFQLLSQGGWVSPSLLTNLKNMVGFRNIAVHEYQTLQLPITVAIITQHLGDFLAFSSFILTKDASQPGATPDTHPD